MTARRRPRRARRHLVTRGALAALPLALLAIAAGSGSAHAGLLDTARFPVTYRTWTTTPDSGAGEATVSQLVVPFVTSLRLGSSADLVLSTAGASSKLDVDGGASSSLGGAADVTAQLFLRAAGDRLLLQAGANLPSGKRELSAEELSVAAALGHPLLGFGLKQYGRGFDLSAGAGVGFPLGARGSMALGAGVIRHGSYTLVENGDDYEPAPEVSISAGLDVGGSRVGGEGGPAGGAAREGGLLRLDATYRLFGEDKLDGETIFEEGDQIELQALAATRPARVRASALARLVVKSDNTAFSGAGGAVGALKTKAGNGILLQGGIDAPLGGAVRWGVDGEMTRFSGSDTPGENGTAFGVGPSLGIPVGAGGSLRLRVLYLFGSIDSEQGSVGGDLSGLAVSAGLRWRAGS